MSDNTQTTTATLKGHKQTCFIRTGPWFVMMLRIFQLTLSIREESLFSWMAIDYLSTCCRGGGITIQRGSQGQIARIAKHRETDGEKLNDREAVKPAVSPDAMQAGAQRTG